MEFKKTVRLNPAEQKLIESIAEKLAFKTENKVSNFNYQTHRIKNLKLKTRRRDFDQR